MVVCSMGDGTSQQGEVMEGIAEASRAEVPVLFVIEDNGYAISTPTAGKTFYSPSRGAARAARIFTACRSIDSMAATWFHAIGSSDPSSNRFRTTRRAAIVVFRIERLADHSNSDNESRYRSEDNRRAARETGDPIQNLALRLLGRGTPQTTIDAIEESVRNQIRAAVEHSLMVEQPHVVFDAKAELRPSLGSAAAEFRGEAQRGDPANGKQALTMLEAIREVLRDRLAAEPRVCLFGEDIEDPKGDVFG